MIDHKSQRFELRSRTRAPFRIAQLDLAKVWGPGGKKYQTRVRNLQKPPIFAAVTPTGLLLERVDEALRGHR